MKDNKTLSDQKHLLVIDDEENMRHMLAVMLKKSAYHVDTAANGHEGLQMIRQTSYDYILCDIKMPVMDGMEFLQNALDRLGQGTIIMMSAYGTIDTAIKAMKLGASAASCPVFTFTPFDVPTNRTSSTQVSEQLYW